MTNTAHTNCTHPATKAGRAACRRTRRLATPRRTIFTAAGPFLRLINEGTLKHRRLVIVQGFGAAWGNPGYACSPMPMPRTGDHHEDKARIADAAAAGQAHDWSESVRTFWARVA